MTSPKPKSSTRASKPIKPAAQSRALAKQQSQNAVLHDESFIAKLGIISIQSTIDEDNVLNRRWLSEFRIGDAFFSIEGFASDLGRPRGVDTDIYLALQTLYILNGCPDDQTVTISAYELIRMVYTPVRTEGEGRAPTFRPSSLLYKRTRDSLRRLWRVGFVVHSANMVGENTWGNHKQVSLQLLQRVSLASGTSIGKDLHMAELDSNQVLQIKFSDEVAESLRNGNTFQLDWHIYSKLKQPVARALYRLLEAHRPKNNELTVGIKDWTAVCGIIIDKPSKVRRMLEAAHDELIAAQYLVGVDFTGRGQRQSITYRYPDLGRSDPVLVGLLMEVGISEAKANEVAARYGPLVERAVGFAKQEIKRRKGSHDPIRNPGGYTMGVLLKPENYPLDTFDKPAKTSAKDLIKQAEQAKLIEAQVAREDEQREAQLRAADGAAQFKELWPTLKFMTKNLLTAAGQQALERDCLSGEVSALDVKNDLLRLKAQPDSVNAQKSYLARWNAGNQPQLLHHATAPEPRFGL